MGLNSQDKRHRTTQTVKSKTQTHPYLIALTSPETHQTQQLMPLRHSRLQTKQILKFLKFHRFQLLQNKSLSVYLFPSQSRW